MVLQYKVLQAKMYLTIVSHGSTYLIMDRPLAVRSPKESDDPGTREK